MAILAIDIETVASVTDATMERWRQEARAPSNWKDQRKIERYKEDAANKRLERAALSPMSGRIVAIGLGLQESPYNSQWDYACFVSTDGDEKKLILTVDEIISKITGLAWLVSFNGRRFDFPFLAVRSMKHKLALRHKWPLEKWDRRHRDMYDVFGDGSLAAWGEFLLDMPKTGSGSDVAGLVAEKAWDTLREYCLRDVRITAELWELYSSTTAGGSHVKVGGTGQ